ncbi:tight adherence pilus pseudopilin TadF [Celerinatantimonas yamalensis]|uniref:Tight adherence pilus pseudopilin TadF n=1 Tax=Celerinatantimonas yamalensis TaxID=559956 RepID=A0ABW9G2R6_9GAMM
MSEKTFTTKCTRGVFTIEFAIIALFMSTVIVFTSDMVIKQSVEGMLDRMSYSAVSVLKERTQLYDKDEQMDSSQVDTIDKIVQTSLARTMPSFQPSRYSAYYQQITFAGVNTKQSSMSEKDVIEGSHNAACTPPNQLKSIAANLSPITNEGRRAPLFQVTLCYRTDNWFGQLVGEDYEWIRSNSIILGR